MGQAEAAGQVPAREAEAVGQARGAAEAGWLAAEVAAGQVKALVSGHCPTR